MLYKRVSVSFLIIIALLLVAITTHDVLQGGLQHALPSIMMDVIAIPVLALAVKVIREV